MFLKLSFHHWLRVIAAPVAALAMANFASSQVYLTIDGRDAANLAGDGRTAPFRNPL